MSVFSYIYITLFIFLAGFCIVMYIKDLVK